MAHATTTKQRFPKEYSGFTDCYLAHHNTPSCNKVDMVCTIVSVLYLYLQANRKKPPLDHLLFYFILFYLNSLYYLCSQILLRRLASECIICFGAGNAFVGASPKIIFDLFSYPSHQVKGDMGLQDRSVVEACGILSHNHACK